MKTINISHPTTMFLVSLLVGGCAINRQPHPNQTGTAGGNGDTGIATPQNGSDDMNTNDNPDTSPPRGGLESPEPRVELPQGGDPDSPMVSTTDGPGGLALGDMGGG